MPPDEHGLVPLRRAPAYAADTWGPYYEAAHPPRMVHWIVNWRAVPGWFDDAVAQWRADRAAQRQE